MTTLPRIYTGAKSVAGPLLFLAATHRTGLGEWVTVRAPRQPERRGQIIVAADDVTVVQVLDETVGLPLASSEVVLTGEVATAIVGTELLGRTLNGTGAPLDGLPPPVGSAVRPVEGVPMNPARRSRPDEFIETGISAIDGLNTLVRGQKLPIFVGPGLPGLRLAAQIVEGARAPRGEPFAVVFVAIGITARETGEFVERFRNSGAMERTVLFINEASHPAVERILAPRVGLTTAEFLAFEHGMHVLVVLADMTHYCDALREIATAREEIPGRRGYPGYMYTDLATLYERAGVLRDRPGSVTQIPIVTLPDDDITHPIPDLTGYITEGQIVLDRAMHRKGVFPPIDVLPSLSRLMNAGIGNGKTIAEHREWSDQLYALYALGREARSMAAILGESGLPHADRRALAFADRFEREFIGQGDQRRSLAETIEAGWQMLDPMPREDLGRLSDATWQSRAEHRVPRDSA